MKKILLVLCVVLAAVFTACAKDSKVSDVPEFPSFDSPKDEAQWLLENSIVFRDIFDAFCAKEQIITLYRQYSVVDNMYKDWFYSRIEVYKDRASRGFYSSGGEYPMFDFYGIEEE